MCIRDSVNTLVLRTPLRDTGGLSPWCPVPESDPPSMCYCSNLISLSYSRTFGTRVGISLPLPCSHVLLVQVSRAQLVAFAVSALTAQRSPQRLLLEVRPEPPSLGHCCGQ
eukprot:TRINITY_DN16135_c0_g1_i1.p2 TRINITY_DN16135_c0_g1~~TRINITY_DN16135_c0_g1_i1.p2  ORF type:complete len:111 (-),score=0.82 TRINITY_DN16135_c0_g1_i1:164-496(-)